MAYNVVRDKLTDYAVFKDGTLLLGTADIDLPNIEYLTDTIKGPGIAGEVDMPTMAMTSSMEVKINWRTVNEDLTDLMAPRAHDLEFRGSQAHYDSAWRLINLRAYSVSMARIIWRRFVPLLDCKE